MPQPIPCLQSLSYHHLEAHRGRITDFNFVEINCLMLKHPLDAYSALWRGLSGLHASPKAALRHLNKYSALCPIHSCLHSFHLIAFLLILLAAISRKAARRVRSR